MRYGKAGGVEKYGEKGFTLLELVFVMLLLAVLAGISFAGANHFWKGEEVETSARKMQSVMMRALRLSVANQKPYTVVLESDRLRLIDARHVLLVQDGGEIDEAVSLEEVVIAPGVEIFVRRWLAEDWKVVELETLDFPVSGICEPVRFRLVHEEDVLEFSLHPLTAFPVDERLWVQ